MTAKLVVQTDGSTRSMTISAYMALVAMNESNAGCCFLRDSEAVRDGGVEAVMLGYATGPHSSAWDSPWGPGPTGYYEITPSGRAALAAARLAK